ncbi:MAG: hypothetical protein ICV73_16770, partial [Acetobacteraceae bacterium]|nr:hypothetical protein [Acetobacteraceae bacterium]
MVFARKLPRRSLVVRLGSAAFGLGVAAPASAHHGWGGYGTEEFSLTGTVLSAN